MNAAELPGPALFAALKTGLISTMKVEGVRDRPEEIDKFCEIIFGSDSSPDLLLDSCVYYLVRRLIQFGRYKLQQLRDQQLGEADLGPFISDYVKKHVKLRLTPLEQAKIESLIYDCVLAADRDLTPGEKNAAIRTAAVSKITTCYICGRTITFGPFDQSISEQEKSSWVEVEHQFPRSLGGTNSLPNLALSCHACNKAKADYGDFPDFHYEHLSTHHYEGEEEFKKFLPGPLRVAVKMAGETKCFACELDAQSSGGLYIGRKNTDDNWHFLNLAPFCAKCHPEPNLPYEL